MINKLKEKINKKVIILTVIVIGMLVFFTLITQNVLLNQKNNKRIGKIKETNKKIVQNLIVDNKTNIEVTPNIEKPKKLKIIKFVHYEPEKSMKNEINEKPSIKFNGKDISFTVPIYIIHGRLYLNTKEFAEEIGGDVRVENEIIYISYNNKKYKIIKNKVSIDEIDVTDINKFEMIENEINYSLHDLAKIFDINIDWNREKNTINLFKMKENVSKGIEKPKGDKFALIRLEDFSPEKGEVDKDYLEKTRVIVDYLNTSKKSFHVAWIPRYVNPNTKVDNDPTKDINFYNLEFVYTLDYMIEKAGVIGLHGYTHQHKNEVTGNGFEFGNGINDDEMTTRTLIENSIKSAEKLKLPIGFFEFPHYSASRRQHEIVKDYFNCLYYDRNGEKNIVRIKKGDKSIKYIPSPLGYVRTKDGSDIVRNLRNIKQNTLASFFFHPMLDFKYINKTYDENGYPSYEYQENAILKNILNEFDKLGYEFKKVTDL